MSVRDWRGTAKMTVKKLGEIIGTTTDTGGTATAGTLMAKVNELLGKGAEEKTAQEILAKVKDIKGYNVVASGSVMKTLVNSEKSITQSNTLKVGEVTVNNLIGTLRVSTSIRGGKSDAYGELRIYVDNTLHTTLSSNVGTAYITKTTDVQVSNNTKLRFELYGKYGPGYCNLLTLGGDVVELPDEYFI